MEGYRINCIGLVQGVGFRYFTKRQADELKLKGTVKNLSDGSVEIYVFGDKDKVVEFLKWCHSGPESGHVSELHYEKTNEGEEKVFNEEAFSILR